MLAEHLFGDALEHHLTAFPSGARSDVYDIVRLSHHILVVFHYDDRVADVAQFLQRGYQPFVVALVESDARLVEDVEQVDQLRADLRSQSDALTLTSRQGARLAVECQVVETHLEHEVDACAYLFQDFRGNLLLLGVHVLFHLVAPLAQFREIHLTEVADILVPDLVRQRFAVEPLALTFGALTFGEELVGPFLSAGGIVVVHHVLQVFHHTVEGDEVVARRVHLLFGDFQVVERTVENFAEGVVGNILDAPFDVEVIVCQDGLYLPENHLVLVFSQRCDAAVVDGHRTVGNHLVEVYLVDVAQSLTDGTSAFGRVERELVGCGIAVGDAAGGTHQSFGVVFHLTRVLVHNHQQSVALFHGRCHTLAQAVVARRVGRVHRHLVDHHLYIMVLVAIHLHAALYLHDGAVHADIEVAFAAHGLEEFAVVSLAVADQRRQNVDAAVLIVASDHLQHLLLGVFHHFLARHITVCRAGARVEQTQVVVHLGGGAHGGTRVLVGRLLLDADHG